MRRRAPTISSRRRSRPGLQRAAAAEGIELISVDNRYNPKIAQRNADVLVREKVDLVIEFQTDEHVAPIVAAKYREANIPLIAIEIPHPGATYYGANNYEAGLIGGRYLGRWAKQHWHGEADEIVLIALDRAGSLPQDAAHRHARRHARGLSGARERRRSPTSMATASWARASKRCGGICARSRSRRILVGAINDPSALGALRAFQEAGRADVGRDHGAERVARGPRRAARARHPAHRLGRVLSRRSTAPT